MDRMIVKVQVPISGNMEPKALIYNRDRTLELLHPITPELQRAMAGWLKRFFYVRIVNEQLTLDGEAPWQNW